MSNAKNTMDQEGSFKEYRNYKKTDTYNHIETSETTRVHNEEREPEEFNTQRIHLR